MIAVSPPLFWAAHSPPQSSSLQVAASPATCLQVTMSPFTRFQVTTSVGRIVELPNNCDFLPASSNTFDYILVRSPTATLFRSLDVIWMCLLLTTSPRRVLTALRLYDILKSLLRCVRQLCFSRLTVSTAIVPRLRPLDLVASINCNFLLLGLPQPLSRPCRWWFLIDHSLYCLSVLPVKWSLHSTETLIYSGQLYPILVAVSMESGNLALGRVRFKPCLVCHQWFTCVLRCPLSV